MALKRHATVSALLISTLLALGQPPMARAENTAPASASEPAATANTDAETRITHGVSAFGDLAYGADFQHFNYVNPDAPKGGTWSTGYGNITFDSFNPFILKGNPAIGVSALVHDSLMTSAQDEPASMYGLIAESAEMPEDRAWIAFNIRAEARFQDGTPITAEDVVFSFETLRDQGHPSYKMLLAAVEGVVAESDHRVRFDFAVGAAE